jgi:peroxiredoxin
MMWKIGHSAQGAALSISDVSVGAHLPDLTGMNLEKLPISVNWKDASDGTLLYVFSPSCTWCTRNNLNIRSLAHYLTHARVIGLSLSSNGLKEYVANQNLTFDVLSDANFHDGQRLPFRITPQTLYITNTGEIAEVWLGVWGESTRTAIKKRFGVDMPSIVSNQQ